MRRGAVPPSNQEWLENLTAWQPGVEGRGIYTGTVDGYQNLVFEISASNVKLVEYNSNNGQLWVFDLNDGFKIRGHTIGSNQFVNDMMSAAGIENQNAGGSSNMESLERSDISFKIVPAE